MRTVEIGNRALDESHKAVASHLELLHRRLRTLDPIEVDPAESIRPRDVLLPDWPLHPLRPDPWHHGGGSFSPYGEYRAFISHLSSHFAVEETILRAVAFEGYGAHCASHTALLHRLEDMCAPLAPTAQGAPLRRAYPQRKDGNSLQPLAILGDIEDLIYDHELLEDSLYWDALSGKDARELLQWDETLSIGDSVLDAHHHGLLRMTNRLALAADEVTRGEFMEMVQEYYDLARYHFRIEERRLSSAPSVLADHRRIHHGLLRSLRTMSEAVRDGRLTASQFVNDFLLFWLLDHVQKGDAPAFAALAIKSPPP